LRLLRSWWLLPAEGKQSRGLRDQRELRPAEWGEAALARDRAEQRELRLAREEAVLALEREEAARPLEWAEAGRTLGLGAQAEQERTREQAGLPGSEGVARGQAAKSPTNAR
jgi:hypothetical protein